VIADWLDVHCASTLKLVRRVPSVASRSMCGVGGRVALGAHLAKPWRRFYFSAMNWPSSITRPLTR
jgi:hypothetical protein